MTSLHEHMLKGVSLVEISESSESLLYSYHNVKETGIKTIFSHYYSVKLQSLHILRGFFIQDIPLATEQMLRCVEGSCQIFLLDLRQDSESFGKMNSFSFSEKDHIFLRVPPGVAHAYLSLAENTELFGMAEHTLSLLCTSLVNPFDERLGMKLPNDVIASMEVRHALKYDELSHYYW